MIGRPRTRVVVAAVGCALALGSAPALSAPHAGADPGSPEDPAAQTLVEAAGPAVPANGPVPAAQTDGASHLPSPQSLPPGTTQTAPEPQSLGYLRDLWHAVRSEDVSMRDALLLLAQHPMDAPSNAKSSASSASSASPAISPHPADEAPMPAAPPGPRPTDPAPIDSAPAP